MEKLFYNANDIANILGYSKSKAYEIIKKLNIDLKKESEQQAQSIMIFSGRIPKEYFEKRLGLKVNQNETNFKK